MVISSQTVSAAEGTLVRYMIVTSHQLYSGSPQDEAEGTVINRDGHFCTMWCTEMISTDKDNCKCAQPMFSPKQDL